MGASMSKAEGIGIILVAIAGVCWLGYRDARPTAAPPTPQAEQASRLRIFETELQRYGKTLPDGMEAGTLSYQKTSQTMSTPLVAYLITYASGDPALMSTPHGDTDKAAYLSNTGKRLVWETKFCTPALKEMMRGAEVNIVNGEIVDSDGHFQFGAMCTRD